MHGRLKNKRLEKAGNLFLFSIIALLYVAAFMQASPSLSLVPDQVEYREDYNRDGHVNGSDVVSLITLGCHIPESPVADYNGDSVFNVMDIVTMVLNIRNFRLTFLLPVDTTNSDTTVTDTTTVDTTVTDTTTTDTTVTDTTAIDTTGNQAVYTISGFAYCLSSRLPNIQLTLVGDTETSTFTDASGFYAFQVPNGNYSIIPVDIAGFGFNPPMRYVSVNGANLERLDFLIFGFESIPGL